MALNPKSTSSAQMDLFSGVMPGGVPYQAPPRPLKGSEHAFLEAYGLRSSTRHSKIADGIEEERVYISGAGLSHLGKMFEEIGYHYDSVLGAYYTHAPLDEARLKLAFDDLGSIVNPTPSVASGRRSSPGPLFSESGEQVRLSPPRLPEAVMHTPKAFGPNYEGYEVRRAVDGSRYYVTEKGGYVFEDDSLDPALFLRPDADGSVERVAAGFLTGPLGGKAVGLTDYENYVEAITDETNAVKYDGPPFIDVITAEVLRRSETPGPGYDVRTAARLHYMTGESLGALEAGRETWPMQVFLDRLGPDETIVAAPDKPILTASVDAVMERGGQRVLVRFPGAGPDLDLRAAIGEIATRYTVEAAFTCGPPVCQDVGVYVSIGYPRSIPVGLDAIPDEVFQIQDGSNPEYLTLQMRRVMKAADMVREWEEAVAAGEEAPETYVGRPPNATQMPYEPMSKGRHSGLLVPAALQTAQMRANESLVRRRGADIDGFVAEHLGFSRERVLELFMAEQIDTIAHGIDNDLRGRAMMVGHGTGAGKGTIIAALMHYQTKRGRKVFFMSEKPAGLYTLVRDMKRIGTFSERDVLLLNAGRPLLDGETGDEMAPARSAAEIKRICMPEGRPEWPETAKGPAIIFATPSQFNTDNWRVEYMSSVLRSGCSMMIDEAHSIASSEANWAVNSVNFLNYVENILYASGTWLGASDKISIYYKLFGNNVLPSDLAKIPKALSNGGDAAQEALAAGLAASGAMIRLERPLNITINAFQSPAAEENQRIYDSIAPVFRQLLRLSHVVRGQASFQQAIQLARLRTDPQAQQEFLRRIAQRQAADGRAAARRDNNRRDANAIWEEVRRSAKIRVQGIGSSMFRLPRILTMALLVREESGFIDHVTQLTAEGVKSLIFTSETGDALIRKLIEEAEELGLEQLNKPTYKALLKTTSEVATRIRQADGNIIQAEDDVDPITLDGIAMAADLIKVIGEQATLVPINPEKKVQDQLLQLREWFDLAVREITDAAFAQENEARQERGEELVPPALRDFTKALIENAVEESFVGTRLDPHVVIKNFIGCADSFVDSAHVVRDAKQNLLKLIEDIEDVPVNALDLLSAGLQKRGISYAEINRRQYSVNEDGTLSKIEAQDPTDVAIGFQKRGTDVAAIGPSGSASYDLNALRPDAATRNGFYSPSISSPSATTLVQTAGRMLRFGDLTVPTLTIATIGLPGVEARSAFSMQRKLFQAGATIQGKTGHWMSIEGLPDMFSAEGDVATARLLLAEPHLQEALGLSMSHEALERIASRIVTTSGDESELDDAAIPESDHYYARARRQNGVVTAASKLNRRLANDVLTRVLMLKTSDQVDVLRAMDAHLVSYLEELAAMGISTSGVEKVTGEIVPRFIIPVDPGDFHLDEESRNEFDAPLYMLGVAIASSEKAITGATVRRMVKQAEASGEAANIPRLVEVLLQKADRPLPDTDDDFILSVERRNRKSARDDAEFLDKISIGTGVSLFVDGGKENGIIVGVENAHDVAALRLKIVYPGAQSPVMRSANLFRFAYDNDPFTPGLHGEDRNAILKAFDEASRKPVIKPALVFVGNPWKALISNDLRGKMIDLGPKYGFGLKAAKTLRGLGPIKTPISDTNAAIAELRYADGVDGFGAVTGASGHCAIELKRSEAGIAQGVYLHISRRYDKKKNETFAVQLAGSLEDASGSYPRLNYNQLSEIFEYADGLLRNVLNPKGIKSAFAEIEHYEDRLAEIIELKQKIAEGHIPTRQEKRLLSKETEYRDIVRDGTPIHTYIGGEVSEDTIRDLFDHAFANKDRVMGIIKHGYDTHFWLNQIMDGPGSTNFRATGKSLSSSVVDLMRRIPGASVLTNTPVSFMDFKPQQEAAGPVPSGDTPDV